MHARSTSSSAAAVVAHLCTLLLLALLLVAAVLPSIAQDNSTGSGSGSGGGGGGVAPTPNSVVLDSDSGSLIVNGKPFEVRGLAYSPVPVGESVLFAPSGDYFTPDYVYLWARDLPAIAAAGFNTLRIYGWNNAAGVDHTLFLDACMQHGLFVILTHFVAPLTGGAVLSAEVQNQATADFLRSIQAIGDHPALLLWSFGNELNGQWNGFKDAADKVAPSCNWGSQYCENQQVAPGTPCFIAQDCMYERLFGFFNAVLGAAKAHTTRPLTSTFADVDRMIGDSPTMDRIARFDHLLPNMDLYAFQLYRGGTFGNYFSLYSAVTQKPLLVGEYGVDAYNDPCGWTQFYDVWQPCFNYPDMPNALGGVDESDDFRPCSNPRNAQDPCLVPGVRTQTSWDTALTNEIHSPTNPAKMLGGVLMEWTDEWWKSIGVQDACSAPCDWNDRAECADPTSPKHTLMLNGNCRAKAHVTCSNYNTSSHDLCGYWLQSAPEQYVNEAWFGLNSVEDCGEQFRDIHGGHRLSALTPRPIVAAVTTTFAGNAGPNATPKTCEQLGACWRCANSFAASQDQIAAGACNDACGFNFGDGNFVQPNSSSSSSTGGGGGSSSGDATGSTSSSTGGGGSGSSSTGAGGDITESSSTAPNGGPGGSTGSNVDGGGEETVSCAQDSTQSFCGAAASLQPPRLSIAVSLLVAFLVAARLG